MTKYKLEQEVYVYDSSAMHTSLEGFKKDIKKVKILAIEETGAGECVYRYLAEGASGLCLAYAWENEMATTSEELWERILPTLEEEVRDNIKRQRRIRGQKKQKFKTPKKIQTAKEEEALKDRNRKLIENAKYVPDGIYDVTDIEFLEIRTDNAEEVAEFIKIHPAFCFASAYDTGTEILLSGIPAEFKGSVFGGGFNYGSTNILTDCPKKILILAEND